MTTRLSNNRRQPLAARLCVKATRPTLQHEGLISFTFPKDHTHDCDLGRTRADVVHRQLIDSSGGFDRAQAMTNPKCLHCNDPHYSTSPGACLIA